MKYLSINSQIAKPVFDVEDGTYNKTQIVQISFPGVGKFPIFYSTGFDIGFQKYWGPITIKETTTVRAYMVIGNQRSEEAKAEFVIEKNETSQKGNVVVIGGAEHCKEIHKKIIDLAGGPEHARIVFMPASSAEPYESGMDRFKRFSELGGLEIDYNKVPDDDRGEKDFSSILNESKFWILPGALIDDQNRPNVDESLWRTNGFKKEYAEKLRDGGYNTVFLSGGNQARYMKCLYYPDGTEGPVLSIIREIYEEKGGVIAGTSSGGAFLSRIMMLGGGSYGSMLDGVFYQDVIVHDYFDTYKPFKNRVWLGTGAVILNCNTITDTHFIARGRIGRLITACLYLKKQTGKNTVGIGVDEDTSAISYPDNWFEVVGASSVLVIDTSEAVLETAIEPGRFKANDIRVHYLEAGDRFHIDEASGSTSVEISKEHRLHPVEKADQNYCLCGDVFGRDRLKTWLYENFITSTAEDIVGFEIIDNLEDSSDSIFYYKDVDDERSFVTFKKYYDLAKYGSALVRFKKKEDTVNYQGFTSFHWWGENDRNYPNLEEISSPGYSTKNMYIDIMHLTLLNFPDLSDAYDMPLKSDYNDRPEVWQEMFRDNKRFRLGMTVIPLPDETLELQVFFFDYAYYDYDRNGRYSPPRLMERFESNYGGLKYDYDIIQIDEARNVKVFINDEEKGYTDVFGKFVFQTSDRFINIKVEHEYIHRKVELEMKNLMLPISEAVMKFTDRSY